MVALKIEDIKTCTEKLFLGEDFDSFLIREANIVTFNSFTINGHIRKGYYTSQELEEKQMEHLSYWKMLRPFCFSLIKGKRLPESFSHYPSDAGTWNQQILRKQRACGFGRYGTGSVYEHPVRRRHNVSNNRCIFEHFYAG